ncbi:MAG: hypothetical protein U1E76_00050 [Planctomycetota bacterium]
MMLPLLLSHALVQVPLLAGDQGYLEVVVPVQADSLEARLTSESPASVVESRTVMLHKGVNRLRFDWSRERVDESSVHLDAAPASGTASITARSKIWRLGNSLYFDVDAAEDTSAVVTARYLLAGIGWRVAYTGLLESGAEDADVPLVTLKLAVEVTNNSGKDLHAARIAFDGGVIERLSLLNGERREVEVARVEHVPTRKRYIYDPGRFGATPGIEVEVANQAGTPLARELLPAGRIRMFAAAGSAGRGLIGEDVFPSTALGERARFSLGHARDLVVERVVLAQQNENERRDRWNKVVAYDQRAKLRFKVQNGMGRPVELTVVEKPGAPLEVVACGAPHEKKKADTLEIKIAVAATAASELDLEWLRRNLF